MTTENAASIRKHAAELAAFAPDAILAFGASTVGPLLQETRTVHTVPIVLSRATSSQICFQLPLPFVDYSDDCEVLEIILPAEFKTVELE